MSGAKEAQNKSKDKWILIAFLAFFGVIFAVNGVFIYIALGTHTGVITKNPYRKGLAYNEVLDKARMQPVLDDYVSYDNGVLSWNLRDHEGVAIVDVDVRAKFVRRIQEDDDFEMLLEPRGEGVYEVRPNIVLKGQWEVKLKAVWNNSTEYQRAYTLLVE